jgi:hypothetical protein
LITEETETNQEEEAVAPPPAEEVQEAQAVEAVPAASKGIFAIAMYDYEAGEDNEISKWIVFDLYVEFTLRSTDQNPIHIICSFPRSRRDHRD